jgi:hypothetical protein
MSRKPHVRGVVVGKPYRDVKQLGATTNPDGKTLVFEHTNSALAGSRCGVVWGDMAPPGDKPGTLHWCMRKMAEVADPDGLNLAVPNPAGHIGDHRCTCGEYHPHDPAPVVTCRFPLGGLHGPECGQPVIGLHRDAHTVPASIRKGRPAAKFQVITSTPCGHVVRRGF